METRGRSSVGGQQLGVEEQVLEGQYENKKGDWREEEAGHTTDGGILGPMGNQKEQQKGGKLRKSTKGSVRKLQTKGGSKVRKVDPQHVKRRGGKGSYKGKDQVGKSRGPKVRRMTPRIVTWNIDTALLMVLPGSSEVTSIQVPK